MSNSNDPFASADRTVVRPRPGGMRRGGQTASEVSAAAQEVANLGNPSVECTPINDFVVGGCNATLVAAAPLLALAARLRYTASPPNLAELRDQALQEVRAFDERLHASGVASEDALIARYLLCTFFDSAVLNTPWGTQSDWSEQPLLLTFHKEMSGAEKFFQILQHIDTDPARYIDLLELQYICLTLGFEGTYHGQQQLTRLQQRLYCIIRDTRAVSAEELAVRWCGVAHRQPLSRYVPWWIVAAGALALLSIAFVIYNTRLNETAGQIKAVLSQPSVQLEYRAVQVPRLNRLQQLLAPQAQAGELTVEDFGAQTVITLIASNLFTSGRTEINPLSLQTLTAIARALDQVTGKVVVIGHTDDQPLQSLEFADNFELSRERAVVIANQLKPAMTDSKRVEWVGAGSLQPRYRPVDSAQNRARNRRMEIVAVDGGS